MSVFYYYSSDTNYDNSFRVRFKLVLHSQHTERLCFGHTLVIATAKITALHARIKLSTYLTNCFKQVGMNTNKNKYINTNTRSIHTERKTMTQKDIHTYVHT